MSGGGNDFLVVEAGLAPDDEQVSAWVRRLCHRGLSVGADGVLIVGSSATANARLVHYNADGTRSSLCGNGSRCAARWVRREQKLPGTVTLETDVGVLEARFPSDGQVSIGLPFHCRPPEARDVALGPGETIAGHFVEVGVPHFLVVVDSLEAAPVQDIGSRLRNHARFQPQGTNVSFVRRRPDGALELRTFERGVERETLACGTACIAAALLAAKEGWSQTPLICHTRSGIELTVEFDAVGDGYSGLRLVGDARFVYQGDLSDEGLVWGGS